MTTIASFRDLDVWREGHKLVLVVYKITQNFPIDERFGLISQMRRSAISVPANIAEGFKRRGIQDKIHRYNIAEASLEELKDYFMVAEDLGYASTIAMIVQSEAVGRLLNGFIESTERRR